MVSPSGSPSPAPAVDGCLVTRPNEAHTDAWPASALDIGEGGLFTVLWPDGTVVIPASGVDRDGIGWMKFVFQREGAAEGELRIGGRRIGAEPSDPLGVVRADIPDGYGTTGVQATAIGFPTEGCWEVIATSGSAQLRFVTRVVFEPSEGSDLVGSLAPRLMLERADGGQAAIPAAAGRPTVITFLASWCPPCADEAAAVAGIAASGAIRVLVAVEDDPVAVTDAFGAAPIPVLLDPDGSAFAAYQGFGLPLTVFIDSEGVIRSFVAGPLDETSIAAGMRAIEPVGSPTSSAEPVTSTVEDDTFRLTIQTERSVYPTTEAIPISATLELLRTEPTTIAGPGSGPLGFGIEQLDGPIDTQPGWRTSCRHEIWAPGEVRSEPFAKSGGFGADDPMAEFWRAYFDEPDLILPAGRYRVFALVDYDIDDCSAAESVLTADVRFEVIEAAPPPSPRT